MLRATTPSTHQPPPRATAESDASDSAKSQPVHGRSNESVPSSLDHQPATTAAASTGSNSNNDERRIRSEASRVGLEGANSADDNPEAAVVEEKPGSTRRDSDNGTAERSSNRDSTAAPTSSDGIAKPFVVTRVFRFFFRSIPYIGYHHVLMVLLGVIVLVLRMTFSHQNSGKGLLTDYSALVLAGCTRTGPMQAFRLMSISYAAEAPSPDAAMLNATLGSSMLELSTNETKGAQLVREVQVGYFSICVRLDDEDWECGSNGASVPGRPNIDDALGLIDMGHLFRTKTVSPVLFIITILLCAAAIVALSTFPGWHEEEDTGGSLREVKPFPSRAMSTFALLCSSLATAVAYVAALWQHTSCAATGMLFEALRYGAVEAHTGMAAVALGWMSVLLCAICGIGMIVMILSIRIVANL
ncbi:hypothetical protein JDV02_008390 [Purpureocillium takamizusanense]|uniref:Uncharacterized protein n=1 Tax=Purpureocillium takamizusanense TaxID=2060973 RepID=A0A9Q8VF32_9HYPO|nr:uncharacterized protein JDV02_008390 [Purpureocillium takamizusanense]UNI22504.1 hypothetical protein JDV02_008390 [Purpureocillium takamizusanense]